MEVRVDEEACVGDETCVEVCPEIFEMQGDVAVAKMEEVPEELEGGLQGGCRIVPSGGRTDRRIAQNVA